jgi:hypothetical protein
MIRGGSYPRRRSFTLDIRDSGSKEASIIYRAMPGEEVVYTGGVHLDPKRFTPVREQETLVRFISPEAAVNVVQANLKEAGIRELGPILPRGFPHPVRTAPSEMFFNDAPMTLARWPNEGFVRTGEVLDPGVILRDGDKSGTLPRFLLENDRPKQWNRAEDIWLFGYWKHDWADESIRVDSIDPEKRAFRLARPHIYGVEQGKPFFAENLLEEIDRPGEYYINRKTGMLYFWPPEPLVGADIAVSILAEPLVLLRETSHVSFEGMVFCISRDCAFRIEGGADVRVAGCTMKNLGSNAVTVRGGRHHLVVSCDIHRTGEGGIVLVGGERASLKPGKHEALNNHIHDFSRRPPYRRRAQGGP